VRPDPSLERTSTGLGGGGGGGGEEEPANVIICFAGQAPTRRGPLRSNVSPHKRHFMEFSSVIVALDFPSGSEAMELVDKLGPGCSSYKVGLQLLTEEGPAVVRELVARGKSVFLDLKLHEIPNSVSSAVRAAGKLGAGMVTVHASGGSAVLRAAVAAAAEYPSLQILALTVITSLTDNDLPAIGLAPSVRQQVERLAQLSTHCGCHGIVASAHEAMYLKALLPLGTLIVTPGIQLVGAGTNDQARVATPEFARRAGATHVVIGRSITQASNPHSAFVSATAGMASAGAGQMPSRRSSIQLKR
jgi:orotidine-5'-phosphate decarboxylase